MSQKYQKTLAIRLKSVYNVFETSYRLKKGELWQRLAI